ncbi:Ankyrin repeat region domain-containing protein [Forsythia ovata]|uniref:Ankyrin repeat region domain-containing protein n=1 Tax=Forsythia ovata TaxID=205694 RepID=A0ABD1W5Y2_9LAMI
MGLRLSILWPSKVRLMSRRVASSKTRCSSSDPGWRADRFAFVLKHYQLEAFKLLVKAIGDQEFTNSKDNDGNTSLHLAVAHKQVERVNTRTLPCAAFGAKALAYSQCTSSSMFSNYVGPDLASLPACSCTTYGPLEAYSMEESSPSSVQSIEGHLRAQ